MIRVQTINVDGKEVEHVWDSIEELKADWYSDDCAAPSLDDPLVSAEVDSLEVNGENFKDVMDFIRERYKWDY